MGLPESTLREPTLCAQFEQMTKIRRNLIIQLQYSEECVLWAIATKKHLRTVFGSGGLVDGSKCFHVLANWLLVIIGGCITPECRGYYLAAAV